MFDNLALINKSIREIYARIPQHRLENFKKDFHFDSTAVKTNDPVIVTQHLAIQLAQHFQVAVSTVLVTFRSDLPTPGHVELSSGLEFHIELHSQYKSSATAISAILAHEVAHIFLHQAMIKAEPTFANEVLTDTTAAFLGCGLTILNGSFEIASHENNKPQIQEKHFGYISLEEFGYIQAKRQKFFTGITARELVNKQAAFAVAVGSDKLFYEMRQPPYSPKQAPRLLDRVIQRIKQTESKKPMYLVFPCACCSQSLRVPLIEKKIIVHCPVCHTSLRCYA